MIETDAKAEVFHLRTPLLSKGRLDTRLVETDHLWVWIKSYAEGGENVLHAHEGEDHIFVILQGQATFLDQDGGATVLGRNDGIMLRGGVYYSFQSSGDEPLVLLRVGAWKVPPQDTRVDIHGNPLRGYTEATKYEAPVVIEGAYYE
jgi:mannose-6-phosphate isomerase-like protein (cupin superfamily)